MSRGLLPSLANDAACRVVFGSGATPDPAPALHVNVPHLDGRRDEVLLAGTEAPRRSGSFTLFAGGGLLAGVAAAAPELDLEAAAARLYDELFALAGERHLYRIWNYVPRINAIEDGLENYRRFCRGRSLAFERRFGSGFQKVLPAASAVGTQGGPLALGFVAGEAHPRHFENPRQVPAFEYPPQYGPRPPSFARATACGANGAQRVYISGTAAIFGHASVAAGDLDRQLTCTLENLTLVTRIAGAARSAAASSGWTRRFKAYLRRPDDLGRVAARLETDLLREGDHVQYLHAELCRAELLVEIEAVLATSA